MKQTDNPTLKTIITAGIADKLIFKMIITPNNCTNVAMELNTISTAAQYDNRSIPAHRKAVTSAQKIIRAKNSLRFMYCSQNMNGIPDG